MTKKFLPVACSFLILVGLAVLIQTKFCGSVQATCGTTSQDRGVAGNTTELAQNYFVYSPATLAYAQSKGKTVLYFWAPWCSTCSSLDTELQKPNNHIPDEVTILRVDYDTAKDLKLKYGITLQHTFVQIDSQGNAITTWVGGELDLLKKNLR